MAVSYGTRAGVFGAGVPRGALVRPARLIEAVDSAANVVTLEGHGLALNDAVEFTATGAGVLPGGLAPNVVYYAKPVILGDGSDDENRFQVAASPNGAAIDLTSAGVAPMSAVVPIGPTIDKYLEVYSRWADSKCPGHIVPFTAPYPAWVVSIVELRTATKVMSVLGRSAPALATREATEIADFLSLASGKPLRDAAATAPANTAIARTAEAAVAFNRGTLP